MDEALSKTTDRDQEKKTLRLPQQLNVAAGEGERAKTGRQEQTVASTPQSAAATSPARRVPWRRIVLTAVGLAALAAAVIWLVPLVRMSLNTVSTDDAYVNSHVTFVAP